MKAKPLRALIVEDSASDAELIVRQIKHAGYDVRWERVDDAAALKAALDQETWDVILSDYRMPGLTGTDVLGIVRAGLSDVPFIFVSGAMGEDLAVEAMRTGAHDYVMKGNLGRLVPAIERELRDAEVRRESQQSRKALWDSNEQFRAMFEMASIGMAQANLQTGHWLRVNHKLCEITGYSAEELLKMRFLDITHPDDQLKDWDAFQQVVRGEAPDYRIEKRYLRKDGVVVWVNVNMTVIRDATGQPVRTMSTIEDITERKRAEQTLYESEMRYHSLFDNMEEGFAYCRMLFEDGQPKDFIYLEVNEAFQTLTGLKNVAGRKVSEVIPGIRESDPELFERYGRVALSGQPERFEMNVEALKMWFSISVYCPAKEYFVAVFAVITERKRVEELLQLQSSALEASANAILITDSKGVIEWANAAFTTFTGYSVEEAVGKNPSLLKSGKHDEKFYQNLWETITAGKVWHGELINRRKDGSFYTEEMTITPIKDGQGEITHFIAVKNDITARKRLEEQFLRVQRMESIGTLAGGIAHDLNNVLAPILMAIEILRQKTTDEATREILVVLEASAQHGAELVKQVLAFARGIEGERITVNPVHILNDIQKIVRDTFPKNIHFLFAPSDDLWTVTGDPTQLHQVFTNLCVNARDAMPNGGNLSVTMENAVLDEVFSGMNPDSRPGEYVLVKVQDTGTGIPPKIMERIFEPFFTTKEVGHGTGLGLSTTMAIVKSHGGFINVYSEMGKGTTFKVYLLANTASKAAETSAITKPQLPRGNGELVLVVDDEEGVREIAQKTLERFGYRVLLAANGAEAVSLYAQNHGGIAIVITDMAMPVLDGAATLTALRTMNPKVKAIGSSGYASRGGFARAAKAGFTHFIPKPYTAEALLKILEKALRE